MMSPRSDIKEQLLHIDKGPYIPTHLLRHPLSHFGTHITKLFLILAHRGTITKLQIPRRGRPYAVPIPKYQLENPIVQDASLLLRYFG